MAENSLVMGYVLRKNKNYTSPSFQRWFAYVDKMGTLSTRGLAEHMIKHGQVSNRAEVESILTKLSECIPELVSQGYGVKLDGIGIFYPTIANNKGGAESPADFNLIKHIAGVRFNFRPDSTDLDDLTTKAFGKKVSFGRGYYQMDKGRKAPKYPLAADDEETPTSPNPEPNNNPENNANDNSGGGGNAGDSGNNDGGNTGGGSDMD